MDFFWKRIFGSGFFFEVDFLELDFWRDGFEGGGFFPVVDFVVMDFFKCWILDNGFYWSSGFFFGGVDFGSGSPEQETVDFGGK